jgi:hypothetical protein
VRSLLSSQGQLVTVTVGAATFRLVASQSDFETKWARFDIFLSSGSPDSVVMEKKSEGK